jgi:GT2 family glycosyltransferase
VLRTIRMKYRSCPQLSAERSERSPHPRQSAPTKGRGDFVATEILATERPFLAVPGVCDGGRAESLSVVICAYTTQRWADLCRAVDSVLSQDGATPELILVIDHCHELYLRACNRFRTDERVAVRRNTEEPGLSGARNTGVGAAHGDVIAFIDDDADAEPGWARALMHHYQDRRVAGVGGYAVPIWPERRPAWMPQEFDWVVGCSYTGQPTHLAPVRNPIGCNMSLRRSVLDVVGGFRSEVGRIGSTPVGGEETELCIRIGSNRSSNQILFDPEMRVRHHISPDRATLRYFLRRCHHEGLSKAIVGELANAPEALSSERAYTLRVLPRAVLREVSSMSSDGLARAAVMLLGLAVTSAGYVRAKVGRRVLRGRS